MQGRTQAGGEISRAVPPALRRGPALFSTTTSQHGESSETALSQGRRIRLIFRRSFLQQAGQPLTSCAVSAHHNLSGGYLRPIDLFVRPVVLTQRRAFQRYAGEETARAGVREDFGVHVGIGGSHS